MQKWCFCKKEFFFIIIDDNIISFTIMSHLLNNTIVMNRKNKQITKIYKFCKWIFFLLLKSWELFFLHNLYFFNYLIFFLHSRIMIHSFPSTQPHKLMTPSSKSSFFHVSKGMKSWQKTVKQKEVICEPIASSS